MGNSDRAQMTTKSYVQNRTAGDLPPVHICRILDVLLSWGSE